MPSSSHATKLSDNDNVSQVLGATIYQTHKILLGRPFEGTRFLLLFINGKEEPSGLSEKVLSNKKLEQFCDVA